MTSVVLLYSGGADSTLAALLLRERGWTVHALSIGYEGRPLGEVAAAAALASGLSFASFHVMSLGGLAKGAPSWAGGGRAHHEGLVPYRNLLFWSLAANRAASVGAGAVAAGHTGYDAADYDDASPAFFATLAATLRFSGLGPLGRELEIVLPLASLTPQAMADELLRHREVLRRSWSCWRDGERPCGECYACRERTFEALTKR